MSLPYRKGSSGPEIRAWQDWAYKYAAGYADIIGPKDAYFGLGEEAFVVEMQRRLQLPITGQFDAIMAARVGYKPKGVTVPTVPARRKIWIYTAPGSGGNWDQGPSYELGRMVEGSSWNNRPGYESLHINHQPVSFQIGGYLGLMGGDPTFSYNDVIYDQYKSLEWLLDHNPDIADPDLDPDLELWFSGYSQSADGMEDAIEILFGDGGFVIPKTGEVTKPGKYQHLRHRINGLVSFGNPSTKGTGIARKVRPAWLDALVHNVNKPNDFYAMAPDAIRPAFYAIIVEADMELPFFVHVLRVAVPVMLGYVPIFGGLLGPLAVPMVAAMTGLNAAMPLLGGLMGQPGGGVGDAEVDRKLTEMLSVTGLIANIPGLIGLVAALPGLQAHGMYGPADVDQAYNVIAGYRRP